MSCGELLRHPTGQVLCLYALGNLHEAHATAIDRHLRHCVRCQQLAHSVENDLADLALALPPVPVPSWMRESLVHSVREVHRLSDAVPTLRRMLSCSLRAARALLAKIDAPRYWRRHRRGWVLPLLQRPTRRAQLVRLPPLGRFVAPRAEGVRVVVLQGQVRCGGRALPGGEPVRLPARARLAAGAGPDTVILLTWRPTALAARPTPAPTAPRVRVRVRSTPAAPQSN